MDIVQDQKFQTISHCVDLDNDSGKKVLVSVSICHINKCLGCDSSGELGIHKTSCVWNILTNDSCKVHDVKNVKNGCPLHDSLYSKETTPEPSPEENSPEEKTPEKTEDPEPPKDEGGGGLPDDTLSSPQIPLVDASNEVLPVKNEDLSFNDIKRQNETTTCSYVYVDRLDSNLSGRLPNVLTEALASSALNQTPITEPYHKISELTLQKIQELKENMLNSSEKTPQMSTNLYKIKKRNKSLSPIKNFKICPLCEKGEDTGSGEALTNCCFVQDCRADAAFDLEVKKVEIGEGEVQKNSQNILDMPFTEIITTKDIMENIANHSFYPPKNITSQKFKNDIKKLLSIPQSKRLDNQIQEILRLPDMLKKSKDLTKKKKIGLKNKYLNKSIRRKVVHNEESFNEGQVIDKIKEKIKEIQQNCNTTSRKKTNENLEMLSSYIENVKKSAAEMTEKLDQTYPKRRKPLELEYGSKLVLSPERFDVEEEPEKKEEEEETLNKEDVYSKFFKDLFDKSSFLKSLVPPISSNGMFSDAVEVQLQEEKPSLIPWLVRLFVPTCEASEGLD